MKKGATWIDHSTTDYKQTIRLGNEAVEKGIEFLEGPLTGGISLLEKGRMTVFVGGDHQV